MAVAGALQLVIHVWEIDPQTGKRASKWPTLTHTFWGASREEAEDVLEAHMAIDAFLGDALTKERWDGIALEWQGWILVGGKEIPWDG